MKFSSYLGNSPAYLREYLSYISTIKGRAENTVKSYYEDIKLFFRFIKQKKQLVSVETSFEEIKIDDLPEETVKSVTIVDVMEFLHFMGRERNNNPKARMRRAVSLRQFYKYLTITKGWFAASPLERLELPKSKQALPKYLTVTQAETLLDNLEKKPNVVKTVCSAEKSGENKCVPEKSETETWRSIRDFCIITFFLNCGMRLSELAGINLNDCKAETDPETDGESKYLRVTGKGSKERIIYLNRACIEAYDAWLGERMKIALEVKRLKYENALFISSRYKRISNRTIQQLTTNSLKASNLDGMGFSVHKLRHTAATLMYQNGVDVRVLKDVLGHENLNTTQIYTHVANKQLRDAVKNNPLSKEFDKN